MRESRERISLNSFIAIDRMCVAVAGNYLGEL